MSSPYDELGGPVGRRVELDAPKEPRTVELPSRTDEDLALGVRHQLPGETLKVTVEPAASAFEKGLARGEMSIGTLRIGVPPLAT